VKGDRSHRGTKKTEKKPEKEKSFIVSPNREGGWGWQIKGTFVGRKMRREERGSGKKKQKGFHKGGKTC